MLNVIAHEGNINIMPFRETFKICYTSVDVLEILIRESNCDRLKKQK